MVMGICRLRIRTYDQIEAMTLDNRVIVMNKGNIEQIASPVDIYQRPQTVFVAQFMGPLGMNIVKGRLDKDGSKLYLAENISFQMPETYPKLADREVFIGCRPEDTILCETEGNIARVTGIEILGAENIVYLNFNDQSLVMKVSQDNLPSIGSELKFNFIKDKIHFFDSNNSERIEA